MSKYKVFTTKAGFDPNQLRDEDGKWSKKPGPLKDRPCFKEWFKDSKAVDQRGEPKEFYHGTTHEFNEFSKERGNPENDFGVGFYFSSSMDDVDANYDNIGPDLTNRIQKRMEELLYDDTGMLRMDENDAREQAEEELAGGENRIIPVYLSLQNPVVIGDGVYAGMEKETFFDYQYNPDADLWKDEEVESGRLLEWAKAMRNYANNDGYKYNINAQDVISEVMAEYSPMDYGGMTATELDRAMRQSKGIAWAMDDNGNLMANEISRAVFEEMGFDGIIDNTVYKKFGQIRQAGRPMPGIYQDTQHIIAFEPGQIKRSDAKSFCHETDIRKSRTVLIDEKAGYNPSQLRDEFGKWTSAAGKMRRFEKRISKNDYETAGVYDEDGNKRFQKKGNKYTVQFTDDEIALMDGAILTHNHPGRSSFSHADVRFLFTTGLREIRVINTPGEIFRMEKIADYGEIFAKTGLNPIQGLNRAYWAATDKIKKEVDLEIDKLKNQPFILSELEAQVKDITGSESHRIWKEVSESSWGQVAIKYVKE